MSDVSTSSRAPRPAHAWVGLVLGAMYSATLISTSRAIGLARDEGFYAVAARAYGQWLQALMHDPGRAVSRAAVDLDWSVNHEHPPLIKMLFTVSVNLFHERLGVLDLATSLRLPAMILAGCLVALVYVWGARVAGPFAGIVASVSLAGMPRFFFHAHLACFDVPIAALFAATVYAFVRAAEAPSRRRVVRCALLFGLALASKHNAWFLPPLFLAASAAFALWAWRTGDPVRPAVRGALAALGASLVVGPLVLWALWPWIWRDTLHRLGEYAAFHLRHEFYNMEFLGESYWRPPFPRSYAPLMTAATVPTTTLLLALVGVVLRARAAMVAFVGRTSRSLTVHRTAVVWVLAILVSYAPWVRDSTPIFGGTKHWMTAYPFLALFAGVGAEAVRRAVVGAWRALASSRVRLAFSLALGAVLLAPSVVETEASRPFGTSAYVPLVGGAPGAATLGLNRGFWGTQTGALLPRLEARPGGEAVKVFIHDTLGASWDVMHADGWMPAGYGRTASLGDAEIVLQHHEMHMQQQEYQAWVALGTTRPHHVWSIDGVPVMVEYWRPGSRSASESR